MANVRATQGDYNPTRTDTEQFNEQLTRALDREKQTPSRTIRGGKEVTWAPQEGSQTEFLACPLFEVLYHGTRGPGKTDALLMSFAQYVGQGHGKAWRGIIFRQTYPQLADIQAKSEKWFNEIFKGQVKFNRSKMMWEWATGEVLLFRHMNRAADYWSYHGHEYPFIGWEEITNWPDDTCYKSMFACCRSSTMGVPRMIRATTNPYGVGHNWVKIRFQLSGNWKKIVVQLSPKSLEGRTEPPRVAIHGHIDENKILLDADPLYKETIIASAANPGMAKAWLEGSWDIVAGGMFDDVWDAKFNVVEPFSIPNSWRIDRSFDWGSAAPFSVGWWAESDGSDVRLADGRVASTVKGDIYRIKEWYGCTGKPNEGIRMLATDVAKGIIQRELDWGLRTRERNLVKGGPADTSIFDVTNGISIGTDMQNPVRVDGHLFHGIYWTRADKTPGSRKNGWELMRKVLKAAHREEGIPREYPGMFIVGSECQDFLRTVLSLPRDEKDMEDIDKNAEDHIADETRYRVRNMGLRTTSGRTSGMY